jgi:hypothetical protein
VSDQFAGDIGTLNQWAMIVTPRAFACTPLAPTAAHVSISGRVLGADLRGVANARVTVTGPDGQIRRGLTNAFGYFSVEDLIAGQNYLVEVTSKRFTYAPRIAHAVDDVIDFDFVPVP